MSNPNPKNFSEEVGEGEPDKCEDCGRYHFGGCPECEKEMEKMDCRLVDFHFKEVR